MNRLAETTSKHVARALRRAGFLDDHQKGSHLTIATPTEGVSLSPCTLARSSATF